MEQQTLNFIRKHHMLTKGDRVLIGLSGGADSVCLLRLLHSFKEILDIEIKAVHVHHGLRGKEADRDAEFSKELCEKLGIECIVEYISAADEAKKFKMSVEEAGRAARYRIFSEQADLWGRAKIATAHHADDNAETILYHLFRGSGLKGLSGIAPVRGNIIRPILWAERSGIRNYLSEIHQTYMEDSTNQENAYMRNKVRNQLIPFITEEINQKAVRNILRAAEQAGEAERYLQKEARAFFLKIKEDSEKERELMPEYTAVNAEKLRGADPLLQKYVIREMISETGSPLKDITSRHIEAVLSLLEGGTGKRTQLSGGLLAEREYETLKLFRKGEKKADTPLPKLLFERFPYKNSDQIPEKQYTKWFDYDKIKDTLSVRTREKGDFIMLPSGGRKTVKSFMIDEKIPREKRDQIPLLAEGNHVLWIVGCRISEYYKITENTKTILKVQLDGGVESG